MAAKTPSTNKDTASVMRPGESAAARSDSPQPMKNKAIMLRRPQRSAIQPAGSENRPKARNDAVPSAINSE